MDLNSAIDIIIKDLNEAGIIIDDLKKYPGVPGFQVELAKSKCRSAAELITLLKSLPVTAANDMAAQPAVVFQKDPVPEPPVDYEIPGKSKSDQRPPEFNPEPVKKEDKEGKEQKPDLTVKTASINKPSQTADTTAGPVIIKKPSEPAIIADKFPKPSSFNEELGSHKHEDDVLEIIRTKPLTRLTEAIGINDKFLFIREIFNGNQDLYGKVIQDLESAGSFSEARAIISDHVEQDADNEAVAQLMDLIKRKFPSNE